MNLAVHPSLNKLDVLRGRDRDWLLVVIEPSVHVAGLEISKESKKERVHVPSGSHSWASIAVADRFACVLVGLLNDEGNGSDEAVVLNS